MEDLDQIIKEIRENTFNFPIFIEGLLMLLFGLGAFVIYKRSKRKKRKFHAPPTHQLPS